MRTLTLLLFVAGSLIAQPSERTIEVKGRGTYTSMPDLGVLNAEMSVVSEKFADAVKGLTAKTEKLTAQLQMIGFKKEEIKTADFSVAKNIVWENNSNVEKGYIARQSVSVEFPNTKEKIGAMITSFMNSENDVRFSFAFILSDSREAMVKDELLKRAVQDARSRADVITAAAQQKIGNVKHISYGESLQHPVYQAAMYKTMSPDNERSQGFDVKELLFSDEVTIVWELK